MSDRYNFSIMTIAVFGLGKMGSQIVRRLHKNNFDVFGWNRSAGPVEEIQKSGINASQDIGEAVSKLARPRIFWIMIPHTAVDEFLFEPGYLSDHLKEGDIVIDGGNSFYKDSVRRAEKLKTKNITFYDCGTSGGVWGERNGFALMVGGPSDKWNMVEPIFKTLSSGENFGLVGKVGAGHFVKMVHNGIEYGMMEAIAEGYAVMEASEFKPDLKLVTRIYQKGSVIQSWLIDLCRNIFENEDVQGTKGVIGATGEGQWTVNVAKELGVDVRVIEDALAVRRESSDQKNHSKFSNKIVALMRKQFGGHQVDRTK